MINEEVLNKIKKAKAYGDTTLYLGGMGITTLPPELFQLTNLTELDLRHNQFSSLPSEICKLTNLQKLNLWNNRLSDQYSAICQLPNLAVLDLRNNQFKSLPPEICNLRNLKELNLYGNYISRLSREIEQLTKLTWLNLGHNHFSILPPEIGRLTNLTKLDLRHNHFSNLPPEIGKLTNLTELNLSNNEFSTFPVEICQLEKLQVLFLLDNNIKALPPEIGKLRKLILLNLSNNRLNNLPREIGQLTKLTELYVARNPLSSPPYEIATKGLEAIRQYFTAVESNTSSIGIVSDPLDFQPENHSLNEVKVLLVGDGAAGKTSLVKRLLGLPFNHHEDTTQGINIKGWQQDIGSKKIRINIWDFGGQVIQHATHQFFLSRRSLYILVLDGRKDEQAEYWLRHIEAFGGGSPVLIVLNKQDENPSFDVNRPFLRDKYPRIRGFYPISCLNNKGLDDFKEALLETLSQVSILGIPWPTSWFTVKRRLEQLDRPYISAAEYKGYCIEAGITEEENRETLVDFLHDLGVAVHFQDFILDAMHVLDPIWVTEAVYKIITSEKMADSKGLLHLNNLSEILPQDKEGKHSFPAETHLFILRLMEKFELCYPVDKEAVLIPQLLPVPEPELAFNKDGSLRFALHYPDFLPPSVFPRFMVKVHKDIHKNTCWRTGVLLTDRRSGVQALVKADVEARRINLWVQGERPREYLHYLRYLLADINSSFEKLTVSERVPMPDESHISADYQTLLEYEEAGCDLYIAEGSKKRYSVRELLGLVQPRDRDELENFVQKVSGKPDEKLSSAGLLNELVEPKITVLGITFDLNNLFKGIRSNVRGRVPNDPSKGDKNE
jgi:small GTP-binding protein